MYQSLEYVKVKDCMVNNFLREDPLFIDKRLQNFFIRIQAPDSLRGIQFVLLCLLDIQKEMKVNFTRYFWLER